MIGAQSFRLGNLPTESPHPKTFQLSELVHHDVTSAIRLFKTVELEALTQIIPQIPQIEILSSSISKVLSRGGKVYIGGCGSTGRLALILETLWREIHHNACPIIGFMAGGDSALVRSIESFEDFQEHGARQLEELGFREEDLFIGCTEGGETPFVIGATLWAAQKSKISSWFLYCNPEDILIDSVERSRQVLTDNRINKLNLFVGPMALAGSTRLQATSALFLALGSALFTSDCERQIHCYLNYLNQLSLDSLAAFIELESDHYLNGGLITYCADRFAVTVLSDTTERAPTFNMNPFENLIEYPCSDGTSNSLCYLAIKNAVSAEQAWKFILRRIPRSLEWADYKSLAGYDFILGYDFGSLALDRRKRAIQKHLEFSIDPVQDDKIDSVELSLGENVAQFPLPGNGLVYNHLAIKLVMNTLSTLTMGRLGRYDGNLMTWVRPSNGKLRDRTVRYVQILLKERHHLDMGYDEVQNYLSDEIRLGRRDISIVHAILKAITDRNEK